jgi:FixJ family two-component response regulator
VDGKYSIFVVDDDNEVRISTCMLLEFSGYAVLDFQSAEELLAAGTAGNANCLVLDYNLSGISGIELVETLRALHVVAPIIILSADGKDLRARAARAGVAAVLRKPVAAEELLEWLEKILASHGGAH